MRKVSFLKDSYRTERGELLFLVRCFFGSDARYNVEKMEKLRIFCWTKTETNSIILGSVN